MGPRRVPRRRDPESPHGATAVSLSGVFRRTAPGRSLAFMTSARTGAELPPGTIAIVTGASRGIGAATARALALSGATVVLAARTEAELAATADRITHDGGRAFPCVADVTDPPSVERLVKNTVATHGRVDIAFNNAGQGHQPKPLADLTLEDFDLALSASARGVFLSMKHEIAAMLENDPPGGAIVNMASTAGLRGVPGIAGYVAAKHAIIGLTETAALDYARHGIRVNAIAPGPIATHRLASLDTSTRGHIAAGVPLGRLGAVEEVAAAVTWLCSDRASFITGTTLCVDGGKLAGGA